MWEQLESGPVSHRFEPLVLIATLALIPVLIIEYDTTSGGWHTFAVTANWVIWAVFAAELVFVLWEFAGLLRAEAKQVPRGRAWYLRRFAMSDLSIRLAPFRR